MGNIEQDDVDEVPPLTKTEEILRTVILWLRWPPITMTGGFAAIWVGIFGPPSVVAIWLVVMVLLVWSQVGGLVDILPRAARWFSYLYERLLAKLSGCGEWVKSKVDWIERIWRDPWDDKVGR